MDPQKLDRQGGCWVCWSSSSWRDPLPSRPHTPCRSMQRFWTSAKKGEMEWHHKLVLTPKKDGGYKWKEDCKRAFVWMFDFFLKWNTVIRWRNQLRGWSESQKWSIWIVFSSDVKQLTVFCWSGSTPSTSVPRQSWIILQNFFRVIFCRSRKGINAVKFPPQLSPQCVDIIKAFGCWFWSLQERFGEAKAMFWREGFLDGDEQHLCRMPYFSLEGSLLHY